MFLPSSTFSSPLPTTPFSSDPFRRKPFSIPFLRPPPRETRARRFPRPSAALRPRPRRNALREKLLLEVHPSFPRPPPDPSSSTPDRDLGFEIAGDHAAVTGSALWSELENWVDRFKEDNDLWGAGTGPVFSVYRDRRGGIVRVFVNEDEIIARCGFGAEEAYVAARIERAKAVARGIESGEYAVPANSSVVEFIEKKGWGTDSFGWFRDVVTRGELLGKVSPRLAFFVICGCVVFWAVMRLRGGEELTFQDREMLRRKLAARKMRERLVKDGVEVLHDDKVLPKRDLERPGLDKEELKKSLLNAKIAEEVVDVPSLHGQRSGEDGRFEDKVKEIRELARKARESERQWRKGNNEVEDDLQLENKELLFDTKRSSLETPEIVEESTDTTMDPVVNALSDASGGIDEKQQMELGVSSSMGEAIETVEHDSSLSAKDVSAPAKPRIIQSVKEAREYLSRRNKRKEEASISPRYAGEKQVGAAVDGPSINFHASTVNGSINTKRMTEVSDQQDAGLQRNMKMEPTDFETKEKNRTWMSSGSGNISEHLSEPQIPNDIVNPTDKSQPDIPDKECSEHKVPNFVDKGNKYLNAQKTVEHDPSLSAKDVSAPVKPRIIQSVKEAREYLSRRNKRKAEASISPRYVGEKQVGAAVDGPSINFHAPTVNGSSNSKRMTEVSDQQGVGLQRNMKMEPTDFESKEKNRTWMASGSRNISEHLSKPQIPNDIVNPSDKSQPGIPDKECSEHKVPNFVNKGNKYLNAQKTVFAKRLEASEDDNSLSLDVEVDLLGIDSAFPRTSKKDEGIANEHDPISTVDKNVVSVKDDIENFACRSGDPEGPYEKCPEEAPKIVNRNSNHLGNSHNSNLDGREDHSVDNHNLSQLKKLDKKNWLKENFHELEPVIEKISEGFRGNYAMAKQKAQESNIENISLNELDLANGDDEIEWMKDEKLAEIVFKVRDNELSGRDPFYSMTSDDQKAFFKGLEVKAETLSKKLSDLHVYLHSRIENIDYGADGISLYDSPEKIVPRWKGPAVDTYPEFLKKPQRKQQVPCNRGDKENICTDNDNQEKLNPSLDGASPIPSVSSVTNKPRNSANSVPRTVIEGSDGSSKAGKKGGKEHWEHTKKWSRGFLEIYNAETDPEVKSAMRNMGKDLDRWITEEEVKEAAKLMTNIPKKQREYIEKKMNRIKREMEKFGPHAVVSKYREYSDEEEVDHLWWLDLKFVLCIELYTVENDEQKIGFYSLEMAPDLELDPKQFHVVAFQDSSDAKHFRCIVQAHLEMLGKGNAFVVARSPKDAFRDAKEDGFQITVIRKGELKLNIDRTLEEVEEEIIEIGSSLYHEKIMRERSVDMDAVMNGLLASDRST